MRTMRWAYAMVVVWLLMGSVWPAVGVAADDPAHPYTQLERPQDILQYYPPMSVKSRIEVLSEGDYYPCSDCHDESQPPNPEVRELEDDHDTIALRHGKGQFWCLTCHNKDNRDELVSLKGKSISFDESFLLCGQCHFQRQKDFFFGGHGKRVESWQGEKVLTPCTECHNPHSPSFKPRKPFAAPRVRKGLESHQVKPHHTPSAVERIAAKHGAPVTSPVEGGRHK